MKIVDIFKDIQSIIATIGFASFIAAVFVEMFYFGSMSLTDAFVNIMLLIIGFYFGSTTSRKSAKETAERMQSQKKE